MKTTHGNKLNSSSGGASIVEEWSSKDPYYLHGKDVLKELKEEGFRLLAWSKDLQDSARKSGTKLQIVPKAENVERVHKIENRLEPIEDTSYEQPPVVATSTFNLQETPAGTPSVREPFYYPPDMSHSDINRAILNLGGLPSNKSRFGSLHALEGNAPKDTSACTHVSPQYAHLLTVLQHKYTTLLRKFEEVNEQRMSYIEGIREYQAKLDNARALLQMHQKEFERVAKRAHELEEKNEELLLQVQELSHRSDSGDSPKNDDEDGSTHYDEEEKNERASVREKVVEVVYDDARGEGNGKKTNDLEEELNEKQKESERLHKSLELLRADMKKNMFELESGIQALYMYMLNATEVIRAAVEDEDEQNTIRKAFTVYDVLKNAVEAVGKLDVEPALENLEDDLRLGFRKQMNEMMETFAELGLKEPECRGCKDLKEKLKKVETDRSRLRNLMNRASGRGKDVGYKLQNLVYMEKLKKPVKVQLLKVGIFRNKFVDASIFIKGKTLVIKRKMGIKIQLTDILRVNFGYESLGYSKYANIIGGYPWNFFTICTKKGYLHFYDPVDSTLELWIAGINHIAGHSFANTEKDVRIRRVRMKILYHARLKGIPLHKLWIKAIRKAAAAGDYK